MPDSRTLSLRIVTFSSVYWCAMHSEEEKVIAIPLSRIKLAALVVTSVIFISLGTGLCYLIPSLAPIKAFLAISFGAVNVVIGAVMLSYFGKMFLDFSPGLLISSEGIVDNTTPVAAGKVPWDEITRITVRRVESPIDSESFAPLFFLAVHVRHPHRYLENGNALERMLRRQNHQWFGTPVRLTSMTLKIKFDELTKVVQENFEKYRRA